MRKIKILHIFVLMISLQHARGCCSECKINDCGNKQYYLELQKKVTFLEAINGCRARGFQLATITCQEENDLIAKHVKDSRKWLTKEEFWTSGNDLVKENIHVWSTTGLPFNFTNWLPGEPHEWKSDKFGRCVAVKNVNDHVGWKKRGCRNKHYFICEEICCSL